MQRVSATIITYNEEKRIRRCLESLSWADEIVVVDSGSSDTTVSICKEYSSMVFFNRWEGYGIQKNICAAYASNDLIFNIDADEIVTPALKDELINLLNSEKDITLCAVPRKNYLNNKWIQHGAWYPDYTVRLYDKKIFSFSERNVHESIIPAAMHIKLSGHLDHHTYSGLTDYFKRLDKYARLSAIDMLKRDKRFSWISFLLNPPFNFIRNYFLRFGFLDGFYGFVLALGYSMYTLQKHATLRELSLSQDKQGDENNL